MGYYFLPRKSFLRNLWFLLGSLIFYFWGESEYIYILLISILLNYVTGLTLGKLVHAKQQSIVLGVGITLNIFLLIWYKYSPFIADNIATLFNININSLSETNTLKVMTHMHLPLGISFFTFQGISYLVDVYRKEAEYERNPINLALYISMFPQLIAGPIVRFKSIADELNTRDYSIGQFSHGVTLFIIGLGYKILIANNVALPADNIFALDNATLTPALAWLGIICYTLQIYFDFCGYSTMAIGLGLMLGFKFPKNFNYPYISRSITEFWRRWHMTLSEWFRDYLYIPLGGNRKGKFRTYVNLMTVFIVCGFWHGAAWNFLFWGLYQGVFLIIERLGLGQILKRIPRILSHIYTMIAVMIGWVIFRVETMAEGISYIKVLFGFNRWLTPTIDIWEILQNNVILAIGAGCFLSTPVLGMLFSNVNDTYNLSDIYTSVKVKFTPLLYLALVCVFVLSVASLANQTYNPFIYFRF